MLYPLAGLSTQFGSGNRKLTIEGSFGSGWTGGFTSVEQVAVLLDSVSGVLRAVLLAGYQATEVRFDTGTGATVVDPVSRKARHETSGLTNELADVREPGRAVVAIGLRPLPLFGPAVHLPFGIPLVLTGSVTEQLSRTVGSVDLNVAVHDRGDELDTAVVEEADTNIGRWLVFRGESPDWTLVQPRIGIAANLAAIDIMNAALSEAPDTLPLATATSPQRTGLGRVFDVSGWTFPPTDHQYRKPDVGALAAQGSWDQVEKALSTSDNRTAFVNNEVVAERSMGDLFNTTEVHDAHRHRVSNMVGALPPVVADATGAMKAHLHTTEAVMIGVEQGVIQPFHSVQLRPDADVTVPREFTDDTLTGVWQGQTDDTVILINQAGRYLQGHVYTRRGATGSPRRINEQIMAGYSDDGGTTWNLATRDLIDHHSEFTDVGEPIAFYLNTEIHNGSPRIQPNLPDAEYWTAQVAPGPTMTFVDGSGSQLHVCERAVIQAHPTNTLLELLGQDALVGARKRSRVPHRSEIDTVAEIARHCFEAVHAYAEDSSQMLTIAGDLHIAVASELGIDWDDNDKSTGDVGYTIGLTARLLLQGNIHPSGESSMQILHRMITTSSRGENHVVAVIMGLPIAATGQKRYYRFKFVPWTWSGNVLIGGYGWGTAELTLEEYNPDSPATAIRTETYDVSLTIATMGSTGIGYESGVSAITKFKDFDQPVGRDMFDRMDGASIDISVVKAGYHVVDVAPGTWYTISAADESAQLTAFDGGLPDVSDSNVLNQGLGEALEYGAKGVLKKILKAPIPSVYYLNAWGVIGTTGAGLKQLRIDGTSVTAGSDEESRFAEADHHLSPEALAALRVLLCNCLPLLDGPRSSIVVDGHTSTSNPQPPDTNDKLSERRATTIIEAIRNILGPQLGVAASDIVATGHGESASQWPDGTENPADRRTVLRIGGLIGIWI